MGGGTNRRKRGKKERLFFRKGICYGGGGTAISSKARSFSGVRKVSGERGREDSHRCRREERVKIGNGRRRERLCS